ncbi:MAG TPA: type II toxin-antitoxin system Phd/YefM family antitoxin [Terracidiphilus sp.]|jgi:prevent-host-death family protein|nr:type II toxin-antitoxin system Phd/YefM family antitoxin [Terracidiphilus sp.]
MRTIAAGQFKAKCLAILDEVNESGEAVVVTKRGKPVARVTAYDETAPRENPDSIFGFMRGMVIIPEGVDLVSSEFSDEEWERMAEEKWNRIERENPIGREGKE